MMVEDAVRRYSLTSHEEYGFFAGLTADNKQVLMGVFCPDLIAFIFDPEGNLLKVEHRPVSFFLGVTPPYKIYDERLPALIRAWQDEMRFQPSTIKVKRFFSDELCIGIQDYPDHFEEILNDREEDEDEKKEIHDSMRIWDEEGQFVLQWGNDYWLNDLGEVVSS
jgi:hypothetical protein